MVRWIRPQKAAAGSGLMLVLVQCTEPPPLLARMRQLRSSPAGAGLTKGARGPQGQRVW